MIFLPDHLSSAHKLADRRSRRLYRLDVDRAGKRADWVCAKLWPVARRGACLTRAQPRLRPTSEKMTGVKFPCDLPQTSFDIQHGQSVEVYEIWGLSIFAL